MVFGCGIDVEELDRFNKYKSFSESAEFLSMIYTNDELNNFYQYDFSLCLALGFSCKEAYFKAFGLSWLNSQIGWTDIELIFSDRPSKQSATVNFYGYAENIIREQSILQPTQFSFSYTEAYVIFEAQLLCRK